MDGAPLAFMSGDIIDGTGPYLSQMVTLVSEVNGETFALELVENIELFTEKGDVAVTLERDGVNGFSKYEDALSYEPERYDNCPAEKLGEVFQDHPAVMFASIMPKALESDTTKSTFGWAEFVVETNVDEDLKAHSLFTLGEGLFREHDLAAFHRCVLDHDYRQWLLDRLR